jgi:hypothetical protein
MLSDIVESANFLHHILHYLSLLKEQVEYILSWNDFKKL